jgi:hypothetical protein
MPKIGPFKKLGFTSPTPKTEDLYIKSIITTAERYRARLEDERAGKLVLPNCDLDSGYPTRPSEYSLTDDTYAKLLAHLAKRKFDLTTPDLRENILAFYSDLSAAFETKKDPSRWQSALTSLDELRSARPAVTVAGGPRPWGRLILVHCGRTAVRSFPRCPGSRLLLACAVSRVLLSGWRH